LTLSTPLAKPIGVDSTAAALIAGVDWVFVMMSLGSGPVENRGSPNGEFGALKLISLGQFASAFCL
jgi:hypothetical protein